MFKFIHKLKHKNLSYMEEISTKDFGSEYPSIIQLGSGQFAFLSQDKQTYIHFDINDSQLLKTLGVKKDQLDYFESCGRNKENDIFEIVKQQGLENEYCLIFGDRVLFHSTSKEDVEKHKKENRNLAWLEYNPM